MVDYPYQGEDLFLEPENYHYAPCADSRFLAQWNAYMQTLCDSLPPPHPPKPKTSGEPHSLQDRLANLLEHPSANDLLPLVHRFEVFRRLWSAYQPNHRKTDDATPAQLDDYVLFGHVLLRHFSEDRNFQWISTALKLVDAIASQSQAIPPQSAPVFHQLLIDLTGHIRSVS